MIYPADWWKDEHEVNHDRLAADLRAGNIEALRPVFDRLNASGRTVLLSCEGLSGFSAATLNNLQALMRRNVADIILLSAMERLDTVSVAAGGKGGQNATLPEYIADILQHAYANPAINLAHIIKTYTEVFKGGSLK